VPAAPGRDSRGIPNRGGRYSRISRRNCQFT
jgi:hypothetical protein